MTTHGGGWLPARSLVIARDIKGTAPVRAWDSGYLVHYGRSITNHSGHSLTPARQGLVTHHRSWASRVRTSSRHRLDPARR